MQNIPEHDISRIYQGFNETYPSRPVFFDPLDTAAVDEAGEDVRLELNDDVATGYWELFRPSRGLLVCLTDGIYHQKYLQTVHPQHDIITIRFVLSGKLSITFDEIGTLHIPQASSSIMFTQENRPFELEIDDSRHLSSVTFHLHPSTLHTDFEMDQNKFPEHLQDILYGRADKKHLYNFPITPAMMNNVLELLQMPYVGARRRKFTQAKAIELICRLFQEIEDDFDAKPVVTTTAHSIKTKIYDAQRILVEQYKKPPTLSEVARRVGLNRTSLCHEFRATFGTTVFEFCQSYRMNKARELLQDRNLSISQVADEVGYDYPSNFTAAFKRHFGDLPKTSRKA
jgi:AraC-like DNA-binding protein